MRDSFRIKILTVVLFCTSLPFVVYAYKNVSSTKQTNKLYPPESVYAQIPRQSVYPENSGVVKQNQAALKPCQRGTLSQGRQADSATFLHNYQPQEIVALADPTNYGERFSHDAFGNELHNQPLIVLHETVISASETIKAFQTSHPNDEDQASYHILIDRTGKIIELVPLEKRAYGAGDSVFLSLDRSETTRTNAKRAPSVNNFAYHLSLESPEDGRTENGIHSGYSEAQYRSLVWLTHKLNVPESRITTHYAVDRSGTRKDPRSFDFQKFFNALNSCNRPKG